MSTDATSVPTTTAQDASAAPAASEVTQTQAPAEGATTATPAPLDFKAMVAERLGGKKQGGEGTPAPAVVAPPVAADAKDPEKPSVTLVKAEPQAQVVDDIDARLRALHDANQRAAEQRKAAKRTAELETKAKSAEGAHAKEVALAKAIDDARSKRDFVGLLKAAGFTTDEMRNSPLIVEMVDQLGKLEEGGGEEQPKPVTEADLERMLKAREEAAEAERKAKDEAERKQREEKLQIARDEYFAELKIHFKAGDYPALKHAKTTQGALDAYRADYVRANPNHRPTPKELLDMAERDLRALWKRNADALAALDGGSPALAAQAREFAPAAAAKAAPAKRTVTSRMTADVGASAHQQPPAERKTYREKEREMKDAFVSRFK
jgi:hypothetical protein